MMLGASNGHRRQQFDADPRSLQKGSLMRMTSATFGMALSLFAISAEAEDQTAPRGYSIPLIDLANETDRQVVIDKEPGQYLGHPSTVLLDDGKTILVAYPKGHGRGAIVFKRSEDGGKNWSDRLDVPENWSTSKETPTLHRVIDPKGVERLVMFSGLYPIRMAVSEDEGRTWSPLSAIGDYGGIVAMGDVVRLRDGAYMALFHDDGRFFRDAGKATRFTVYKTLSTDGGLTWQAPEALVRHPVAHLCEPGVVRSPDGKQLACLLRENSRRLNSMVIFSDDEGETWSKPRELPGSLTGDRHVARYAPDGRIVVTFRDMCHESPTRGDYVAWVGSYEDIAQGREGQYRVRLLDNKSGPGDTGYAGVERLPDGSFLATTYCVLEPKEKPLVVCVRFTLAELDEKAADLALGPWTDLFDGKTLAGWKSSEFGGDGETHVEKGNLHLEIGAPFTGVTLTKKFPKIDYEVELQAKRVAGGDFFCGLTFPYEKSFCSLIVGGWGGGLVGLSSVNYADASENETGHWVKFENDRWYRIRLKVTGKRITASIDGKKIVDLATEERVIGIRPDVEPSKPFGIATWRTAAALRSIRYRRLPK